MTSVSLKADTQAAINAAVDAGGTDVTLNVAAYNDIARDISWLICISSSFVQ